MTSWFNENLAGALILAGLALEALSLSWIGPEAFLTFAFGSGILLLAGMLLYLKSLLGKSGETDE